MIKDVLITVKGEQNIQGERDSVELTTCGRFGLRDGKYFLSYEEGQLESSGKVKTKININSPDFVLLNRSGDIESRMEIVKGERKPCFYATSVGNIYIDIYGEKISVDLNEKGGKVKLHYSIFSGLNVISQNKVEITVKEV